MEVVFFVGWGMSRASKRAKERQNPSPDELVMAETKISRNQYLQVSDVRWTDVPKVRKSKISALLGGSGRSVMVGLPVLPKGLDVRKNVGRPVGQGQRRI